MLKGEQIYPSDLTNRQWQLIKKFIPSARFGGRPRKTNERQVVNAIFYVNRTGCAWRYLPKNYPPWQTVYDYFYKWTMIQLWQKIHFIFVKRLRKNLGKATTPRLVIVDSQSAKAHFGEDRGYDGFKRIRGRKRQILVDTLGFFWGVKVHAANFHDSTRASEAIDKFPKQAKHPEKLLGDFAYGRAPFDARLYLKWNIWPETKSSKISCNLKPKRWIVERTFAWLNHFRRHSKDYEKNTSTSESLLYISQIQLLIYRFTGDTRTNNFNSSLY